MSNLEILKDLCKSLEENLNQRSWGGSEGQYKVDLFSGFKPESYFLPNVHYGTTASIPTKIKDAWFVEIWVNRKCIFRDCTIPTEGSDEVEVEEEVSTRVLNNVFSYGVMSSKSIIEDLGDIRS